MPEKENNYTRKIIHIDMDAFYASVEQRDNPELRGKPVAVGGSGKRGVLTTASYEARVYGVRSAMPSVLAARKCPDLIFVKPRFEVYKKVSLKIRSIFSEYTDLVEPLSLDEAYLDVTNNKQNILSAVMIARKIKDRIHEQTQLTASAGVSVNKFLAKIASDYHKPDGLTLIPPDRIHTFIEHLPVEKFHGIGKVTAGKMHDLGIRTGADLKKTSEKELVRHFGKAGRFYHKIACGEDERPVNPNRIRKSVGAEQTFRDDLVTRESIIEQLEIITDILQGRLTRNHASGRTLTLKVKYADFTIVSRSKTVNQFLSTKKELEPIWRQLLDETDLTGKRVRLLGLTISNLEHDEDDSGQLNLDFR